MLQQIGIAVVEHAGKFLVGVRSSDQVLAGKAEFPGGKCEPDESPEACAVRECREETGLDVVALSRLDVIRFHYPHGDVELHFWRCRLADTSRLAGENGFRWIDAAELSTLNFPEANGPIIDRLVVGLS